MPVDAFSKENMKEEQARAINRRSDIQDLITKWKTQIKSPFSFHRLHCPACKLISEIEKRNLEE